MDNYFKWIATSIRMFFLISMFLIGYRISAMESNLHKAAISYILNNSNEQSDLVSAYQQEALFNEYRFKCKIQDCAKAFKTNGQLTSHKRMHSDERPYVCDAPGCGASFKHQHNLLRHRRRNICPKN